MKSKATLKNYCLELNFEQSFREHFGKNKKENLSIFNFELAIFLLEFYSEKIIRYKIIYIIELIIV